MNNLLNSTEIATVFVDDQLNIRRFTPEARKLINLIQSDIGRPIQHVVTNIMDDKTLRTNISDVLNKLKSKQAEVQTDDGHWYNMHIMPYRTMDNRIDGAVVTFASIDEQKSAFQALMDANTENKQARLLIRNVFDMTKDPLCVVDKKGQVIIANTSFAKVLDVAANEIEGKNVMELTNKLLKNIDLRNYLMEAFREGKNFQTVESVEIHSKDREQFTVKGQILRNLDDSPYRILLNFTMETAKEE
jgi:two-component system CheB/CheR fusion protein